MIMVVFLWTNRQPAKRLLTVRQQQHLCQVQHELLIMRGGKKKKEEEKKYI